MDGITHMLEMWEDEAIIVVAALLAVILYHYATKLWNAPVEITLVALLTTCVFIVGVLLYAGHYALGFSFGKRATWFVVLYLWCVMGMMFFAGANTSRLKLVLALLGQAGILYALFIYL